MSSISATPRARRSVTPAVRGSDGEPGAGDRMPASLDRNTMRRAVAFPASSFTRRLRPERRTYGLSVQSASQPSPEVRLPSSHTSGAQRMPLPHVVLFVQLLSQPSQSTRSPSSHCSPASIMPLPQLGEPSGATSVEKSGPAGEPPKRQDPLLGPPAALELSTMVV